MSTDSWTKVKEWVNENAPMLSGVYQNKYVGMAYDRFASLPPKQQKQVVIGSFAAVVFLVFFYLFLSYLSLWSSTSRAGDAYEMVNLLQQFQRVQREKSAQLSNLEQSAQLGSPGQLKEHLLNQGRSATISPRMMQVEEKGDSGDKEEEGKSGKDVKIKQATVILDRINLTQLRNFLQNVEFGSQHLGISSIKITNDDKVRGYMKVELGIVAYLFQSEEG